MWELCIGLKGELTSLGAGQPSRATKVPDVRAPETRR